MSESWIRRMVNLVEESDIEELEFSGFFRKIRISKHATTSKGSPIVSSSSGIQHTSQAPSAPHKKSSEPSKEPYQMTPEKDLTIVTSPMVGTFYRSSSPEEKPFVEIGDHVEIGQTLCIIEAMKIMNEIQAERAGTVKEFFVENASPVEYGTPLFRIE
ncbi:MAG: acetyl-CoA carboxylase biotin carboxyl carrier protein [Candidatus Marinimicrobia bacterium]|nr:acetyl-CoA carboxylase biotin carboxyl carrier protein [Candidatus Neomarinimicrobiota bacterium]MDD5583333.1 acetyl-CoA carboxylase biotin carboxyl carrier protein [Candidatus Neomarinimicrobiota bacterium]